MKDIYQFGRKFKLDIGNQIVNCVMTNYTYDSFQNLVIKYVIEDVNYICDMKESSLLKEAIFSDSSVDNIVQEETHDCKTIIEQFDTDFETHTSTLLNNGYTLVSSSCNSKEWKAILVK